MDAVSRFSFAIMIYLIGTFALHFPYDTNYSQLGKSGTSNVSPRFMESEFLQGVHNDLSTSATFPKLLIWTSSLIISQATEETWILSWFKRLGADCPHECELGGRERINEEDAAAIVFYPRTMNIKDLPKKRRDDQIYVWTCVEEPHKCGAIKHELPPTYFNTSMTPLRDGVAYNIGYGEVLRTNNEQKLNRISDKEWNSMFAKKKKLGLAIISNCETQSKREYYLKELSKHVQLSLHGKCYSSQRACSNAENATGCVDDLYASHFFYFSFENAICKDYVTEKVFDRLRDNIVPVVLRRKILEGVIPHDAFIAADDFSSPKQLADYLVNVSEDEKLYKRYFNWRESYAIVDHLTERGNGICALCTDLWLKKPKTSANYVVKEHYSERLCEHDTACKLMNGCKKSKSRWFREYSY